MKNKNLQYLEILCSNFFGYRLVSKRDPKEFPILKLYVQTEIQRSQVFLINGMQALFLLAPKFLPHSMLLTSEDFDIKRLGLIESARLRIRNLLTYKQKKYLNFKMFRVHFNGPEASKKLLIYTNKLLTRLNCRPDSLAAERYPELLIGWGTGAVRLEKCVKPQAILAKLAIVLHVYYPETWSELAEVLGHIDLDYDLFITTVAEQADLISQIKKEFPKANVRITENKGRDVYPFLILLEDERLSSYDYICKIHGKRSLANDASGNLGDICRRRTLFDLLVAPGAIRSIIDRFDANPRIGMIGSNAFRLNRKRDYNTFWGANKERMCEVILSMGGNPNDVKPDFFEGTMFWVRPSALENLKSLSLSRRFDKERGMKDGAL